MQDYDTFSHDLNLFQHISLCKYRAEASMSNVEYGFEVVPVTDKSQEQVAGVGSRGNLLHLQQQYPLSGEGLILNPTGKSLKSTIYSEPGYLQSIS